jgi:hypothetical protein
MNLSTPQPEGWSLPSIRDFGESFDPELLKTEGLSRAALSRARLSHLQWQGFARPNG